MIRSKWLTLGLAGAALAGLSACSHEQPKSQAMQQAEKSQSQNQAQNQTGQQLGTQASSQQAGTVPQLGIVKSSNGVSQVPTEQNVVASASIPTVTETRVGADINRMNLADFKALGLSQDQADQIIKYRQSHGPFKSVSQLSRVPNMDQGWLSDNEDRLAVSTALG